MTVSAAIASTSTDAGHGDTLALLKAAGIRLTSPRRAVIAALHAAPGHPTVEQLAAAIPHADLSSVYRSLDVLTRIGAVQQIQPTHGPATYHLLNGEPAHAHAQCAGCGTLLDIPTHLLADTATTLRRSLDFTLATNDVTLLGRCSRCQD